MSEPIATYKGKRILFNNGVVDVVQGETSLVDENKVAHIPEGNVEIDNLTIIKNADNELEVPFDNNTIYRDQDGFIKARSSGSSVEIDNWSIIKNRETQKLQVHPYHVINGAKIRESCSYSYYYEEGENEPIIDMWEDTSAEGIKLATWADQYLWSIDESGSNRIAVVEDLALNSYNYYTGSYASYDWQDSRITDTYSFGYPGESDILYIGILKDENQNIIGFKLHFTFIDTIKYFQVLVNEKLRWNGLGDDNTGYLYQTPDGYLKIADSTDMVDNNTIVFNYNDKMQVSNSYTQSVLSQIHANDPIVVEDNSGPQISLYYDEETMSVKYDEQTGHMVLCSNAGGGGQIPSADGVTLENDTGIWHVTQTALPTFTQSPGTNQNLLNASYFSGPPVPGQGGGYENYTYWEFIDLTQSMWSFLENAGSSKTYTLAIPYFSVAGSGTIRGTVTGINSWLSPGTNNLIFSNCQIILDDDSGTYDISSYGPIVLEFWNSGTSYSDKVFLYIPTRVLEFFQSTPNNFDVTVTYPGDPETYVDLGSQLGTGWEQDREYTVKFKNGKLYLS